MLVFFNQIFVLPVEVVSGIDETLWYASGADGFGPAAKLQLTLSEVSLPPAFALIAARLGTMDFLG